MRGVEATQQLTRLFPNLPVIMFTIQQAAQLQRTCLETGACGFVSKERFNQEFPRLLNQVLRFSVMECAPNALPA
jgi:DNA-binding NarL/FixJ family response regulator